MKKIIPIIIALVIIIGGGAFYGGMKYGQSKNSSNNFTNQNFQNLTPAQRQQFSQGANRGNGSGSLTGEVISEDQQSLTVKMLDGSSKIVFFSDSTIVSKTAEGSTSDIKIGNQVMVSGQQNSDGSYTAKNIQIRPSLSPTPTQ